MRERTPFFQNVYDQVPSDRSVARPDFLLVGDAHKKKYSLSGILLLLLLYYTTVLLYIAGVLV